MNGLGVIEHQSFSVDLAFEVDPRVVLVGQQANIKLINATKVGTFAIRRLERTAHVSANPGLTRAHEDCRLQTLTERNHLIIDDILCGIVFLRHYRKLRDVWILQVSSSRHEGH